VVLKAPEICHDVKDSCATRAAEASSVWYAQQALLFLHMPLILYLAPQNNNNRLG